MTLRSWLSGATSYRSMPHKWPEIQQVAYPEFEYTNALGAEAANAIESGANTGVVSITGRRAEAITSWHNEC